MKAIILKKYGSTKHLELKEMEKPIPKDNEVLVKIHATSVNSWDWDLVKGTLLVNRMITGLFKPKKNKIIGCDIAGKIEAVGKNVKDFKIGDEVFGDISGHDWGGFAEYVCVSEKPLTRKPKNMSFEQAAAMSQAAVLALQGLEHFPPAPLGDLKKGHKVLINGAGGGVGTIAIQLAKLKGAEVTAVDRHDKLDFLKSLGADQVIDYEKEDYTKMGQQYDFILDNVAHHSMSNYKKALLPNGVFVIVGGSLRLVFSILLFGKLFSKKENKKLEVLMHQPNRADLNKLNELFEKGKLKPIVDTIFPLAQTGEAVQYVGDGHVKGKVVVRMGSDL